MNIETLKGEIWAPVPINGFPNYLISNYGRVYSKNVKRLMTLLVNEDGYHRIRLMNNWVGRNFTVHRLVALAFIANPQKHKEVNHIDGVKTNNHFTNLEWCTRSHNIKHSFRTGLDCNQGERHPQAKLTNDDVLNIRTLFKQGYTRKQLAEKFKTKPSNIKCIVLRKSWAHI